MVCYDSRDSLINGAYMNPVQLVSELRPAVLEPIAQYLPVKTRAAKLRHDVAPAEHAESGMRKVPRQFFGDGARRDHPRFAAAIEMEKENLGRTKLVLPFKQPLQGSVRTEVPPAMYAVLVAQTSEQNA